MARRCRTPQEAAEQFREFAAAEGAAAPLYRRLCQTIAADGDLSALLLHAPLAQRLPVLLLAAIHDTVLSVPNTALAPWFPSVTGRTVPDDDPSAALQQTIEDHRDHIVDLLRTRSVQTNEVNRCVGWHLALGALTVSDRRPLALIELGASAGLNLLADHYSVEVDDAAGARWHLGAAGSPVQLATTLNDAAADGTHALTRGLAVDLPPIRRRVGIDVSPLDPTDADDARWLTACVWPEQGRRLERLRAALGVAALEPTPVIAGDFREVAVEVLRDTPDDHHAVLLSSWALAYIARAERTELIEQLSAEAAALARSGVRATLLSLEPEGSLDWLHNPPPGSDAGADRRSASLLAVTPLDSPHDATVLARCQAHLRWVDPL